MTDQWLADFEKRRQEREQADRSFVLLGQNLTYKASVAPQVAIRFNNARRDAILDAVDANTIREAIAENAALPADQQKPLPTVPDTRVTDETLIEIAEETVRSLLEPDSITGWETLRDSNGEAPLTFREIFDVCDYLFAKVSGHPTDGHDGSSNGQPAAAPSSTDESPSTAETPAP